MLVVIGHLVVGLKILAPKLIDLKAALVYVEMNIALLEIRRACLPDESFWVECFYCLPGAVTDSFGVFFRRNKENSLTASSP